jgi:hypothetical protein
MGANKRPCLLWVWDDAAQRNHSVPDQTAKGRVWIAISDLEISSPDVLDGLVGRIHIAEAKEIFYVEF